MTTALATMIAAQPDVIESLAPGGAAVDEAAARLAGARRIWVVGTGTSLHAAELGASALASAGIDARAIAANRFAAAAGASGPADSSGAAHASGVTDAFGAASASVLADSSGAADPYGAANSSGAAARFSAARPGDAAIVITHTGKTAHAIRSRRELLDAGIPLVSVTGPECDWAGAVRTPLAETSETYTVSYTAALTVLAGIAHRLGAPGLSPGDVRRTADETRAVLADPGIEGVPMPGRAMAVVGPGDWAVTAREAALKIREGARILCEGFDPDRLLHGGAVPYSASDTLLVLSPGDSELTAGLAHAARVSGMGVFVLPGRGDGLLAQIPMTVRLQLLALRFARQRGQNADVAITGAWADQELWEAE
jgi:glucosamine--fructose-6-phosphate aminotransferase (isomerizing)